MAKDTTGNEKVTLIKSTIGKKASHKATVIGDWALEKLTIP